jgi:hypothetical protein
MPIMACRGKHAAASALAASDGKLETKENEIIETEFLFVDWMTPSGVCKFIIMFVCCSSTLKESNWWGRSFHWHCGCSVFSNALPFCL